MTAPPMTITDFEKQWPWRQKRLSCGCRTLDRQVFSGGFRVSTINEIVGAAGTGKTQFCLQLLVSVQLAVDRGGLDGESIYISTEDNFPVNRFNQIAFGFGQDGSAAGKHVYVERFIELDAFVDCILYQLPKLLAKRDRVRLLVIDSIAAPFRAEFSLKTIRERTRTLQQVSLQLQTLANRFNLIVICTNQVSDWIGKSDKNPYLGLTWSNHLTNSFNLRRDVESGGGGDNRSIEIRFAADTYAFQSSSVRARFEIDSDGVRAIKA